MTKQDDRQPVSIVANNAAGQVTVRAADGSVLPASWLSNSKPVANAAAEASLTANGGYMATAKNSLGRAEQPRPGKGYDVDYARGKIWNEPDGKKLKPPGKVKVLWSETDSFGVERFYVGGHKPVPDLVPFVMPSGFSNSRQINVKAVLYAKPGLDWAVDFLSTSDNGVQYDANNSLSYLADGCVSTVKRAGRTYTQTDQILKFASHWVEQADPGYSYLGQAAYMSPRVIQEYFSVGISYLVTKNRVCSGFRGAPPCTDEGDYVFNSTRFANANWPGFSISGGGAGQGLGTSNFSYSYSGFFTISGVSTAGLSAPTIINEAIDQGAPGSRLIGSSTKFDFSYLPGQTKPQEGTSYADLQGELRADAVLRTIRSNTNLSIGAALVSTYSYDSVARVGTELLEVCTASECRPLTTTGPAQIDRLIDQIGGSLQSPTLHSTSELPDFGPRLQIAGVSYPRPATAKVILTNLTSMAEQVKDVKLVGVPLPEPGRTMSFYNSSYA